MEYSREQIAEWNRRCGEILRVAVVIETYFDHIIFNYFCFIHDEKRHFFRDSIMNRIDFNRKVEILQKICAIEKVELGKDTLKDINFLKDIRNTVAHFEEYPFMTNKFVLHRYKIAKDGKLTEKSLALTNVLMRQVKRKSRSVSDKLLDIHNKLNKILLKQQFDFMFECFGLRLKQEIKKGRVSLNEKIPR